MHPRNPLFSRRTLLADSISPPFALSRPSLPAFHSALLSPIAPPSSSILPPRRLSSLRPLSNTLRASRQAGVATGLLVTFVVGGRVTRAWENTGPAVPVLIPNDMTVRWSRVDIAIGWDWREIAISAIVSEYTNREIARNRRSWYTWWFIIIIGGLDSHDWVGTAVADFFEEGLKIGARILLGMIRRRERRISLVSCGIR